MSTGVGAVLEIRAGATELTALVVAPDGRVEATGRHELRVHHPRPGWVELAPEEVWRAATEATRECLRAWGATPQDLSGIRVGAPSGPVLLWDRETLGSPRPAIAAPDRRSDEICRRLREEGHGDRVTELTGLPLDPSFPGPRLLWLAEHEPNTWALVREGRYAVGGLDSYLVARMTRGTWHVTDLADASRTLLLDLGAGAWSPELGELFGVPLEALPDVLVTWGDFVRTDPRSFLGLELPVVGGPAPQISVRPRVPWARA